MRLDSHQHFWRYDAREYGWIGDDMAALRRDHLPPELARLQRAAGFDGSVAVQARESLAETEFLLDLADTHLFVRGVVGWVDFEAADCRGQLERLASRPRLRGIRHVLQDDPDDKRILTPAFRAGLRMLSDFGLTYDLLVRPRHLRHCLAVVREMPGQPFVIDHVAKPDIRSGILAPWREDIRALADCPNVCCKVSGMVTEADWKAWKDGDFAPYLDIVYEAFGPDRLMIGSDWPVCTVAAGYGEALGIVTRWASRLPAAGQQAILGGTCARFYGL
jgi:L-fuconolactonase